MITKDASQFGKTVNENGVLVYYTQDGDSLLSVFMEKAPKGTAYIRALAFYNHIPEHVNYNGNLGNGYKLVLINEQQASDYEKTDKFKWDRKHYNY